jgi:hypothetical protein
VHQRTHLDAHAPLLPRLAVGAAALILLAVGLWMFADPIAYQAGMGVEIPRDPSLLSDLRAQAGALLGFAALLGLATLRPRHIALAAPGGAVLFLAYGLSRVVAMSVDGMPIAGLIAATIVELVVGVALVFVSLRARSSASPRERAA